MTYEFPDILIAGNNVKILNTAGNLAYLLDELDIRYGYDVIKKDMVLEAPGVNKYSDGAHIQIRAIVESELAKAGAPATMYEKYMDALANDSEFNPMMDMINSKKWDGKHRLQELADCFEVVEDDDYWNEGFKRFMVQSVAAWDYAEHTPIKGAQKVFETIWVQQAPQGLKKTKTLSHFLPESVRDCFASGVSLNVKNKDIVKQAISHAFVELGELESTFKKSDATDLKAFMSKDKDEMRMPYGRATMRFARRTSFCATVNTDNFLNDATGNRRYFVSHITKIHPIDKIDMQQVWAEVYEYWYIQQGTKWWFEEDEAWVKQRDAINEDAREKGVAGDVVQEILHHLRQGEPTKRMNPTRIWESYIGRVPTYQERIGLTNELNKHLVSNKAGQYQVPRNSFLEYKDEDEQASLTPPSKRSRWGKKMAGVMKPLKEEVGVE